MCLQKSFQPITVSRPVPWMLEKPVWIQSLERDSQIALEALKASYFVLYLLLLEQSYEN